MRKKALLTIIIMLGVLLVGCAGGGEADETAPVISDVSASDITQISVTITWTTDEPATSQVEYGLTTSYGSTTPVDDELVTSHSVTLDGLDAGTTGTTYHYRVRSTDGAGNEAVSADHAFTIPVPEEVVAFPDANLEAAIREAIDKPEGDIYQSDLDGITELDASNRDITNLTGLQHCTSLTELTLKGNQISDITPLINLIDLTELNLRQNQISNITSLSSLTSLTMLDLQENQLSDVIPLSNLTSLTVLSLGRNQISGVTALSTLTSLTELYLDGNYISDISPLAGLTALTNLDIEGNQISDVSSLENLTSLTWLHLGENQVSNISPLSNLTSLTVLWLGENQISHINPLSNLTSLKELLLDDNQISDISPLSNLTNLGWEEAEIDLDLSGNEISDIEPLVNNEELSDGDTVDLRDNPLSTESLCTLIPQLEARGVEVLHDKPQVVGFPDTNLEAAVRGATDKPEGDIDICDLAELTSLYAAERDITDMTGLEYCTSLTQLYLNENQIGNISPLSNLTGLMGLYLPDNQIGDITPLSNLTSLTELHLHFNQIIDITPLSNLTSLTELYLLYNQISDITPLQSLTSLGYLSLGWNQIDDISPLEDLTDLVTLNLVSNQISDLTPLSGLSGLTYLHLNTNQITDVSPLGSLTGLTVLNINGNQISDISPLSNLAKLAQLDLHDNQIADITPLIDNMGLSEGDTIDLQGNPLSAESLYDLIPQLQARGVEVLYDTPPEAPVGIQVGFGYEVEHIVQPSIMMPTDVDIGPGGDIYIAEWNRNRVVRVGLDGTVSTYVELELPISTLLFDSEVNLFVPQGESIVKISPTLETSIFATDIAPYGGWDFGPSGDLFVGYGGDIIRLTPEGERSVFATNIPGGDMAISPSGDIYLAHWPEGKIYKVDTNGVLTTLASGYALDAFNIGFDNEANLYENQDALRRVSLEDGSLGPSLLSEFTWATNCRPFVFHPSGDVVFIGPTTHTVVRASIDDETAICLVEAVGNSYGLVVSPSGDLLMGACNAYPINPGRIVTISSDGSIDDFATGFTVIHDMTLDASGNIYVCDVDYAGTYGYGSRLLKIDWQGAITTILSGSYELHAIAVDPASGDIIAFEHNSRSLLKVTPEGDVETLPISFGGDEFSADLTFDKQGNLIALVVFEEGLDTGPVHRGLYRISPGYEVTLITDIDTPLAGTEDDVFVHPSGDIFVVGVEEHPIFRMLRITPEGDISVFAKNLPYDTYSLVINEAGDIFFCCSAGLFKISEKESDQLELHLGMAAALTAGILASFVRRRAG